jgi:cysteine desulfurase / selenocysteine lyase
MDLDTFRRQMPVTRSWAYLDHAAVSPLPEPARAALAEWANDVASNGLVHITRWIARIEEVRRQFGRLLNADPLDVAFVKNTSEGVGIVAEGLPWEAGDNVVTVDQEYPANVYPWMNLASRGVTLRRVASRPGGVVSLDDLDAAIDARTRVVTLSFVEFATGFRNDLDAVGRLCRDRGALFFVDAIQGLGVLPIDVAKTPIDFLAADGHKWLLGPEGAGVFWVRRELIDRLRPVGVGWNSVVGPYEFSTIDFRLKPHAGRYESGTLNVGGTIAMGASLDLLLAVGVGEIETQILALTDRLCEGIAGSSWRVFGRTTPVERSGIVSLESPPGRDPAEVVRSLRAAGVVVNCRAGRLRVSPHAYNTTEEIDRLVGLLAGLS